MRTAKGNSLLCSPGKRNGIWTVYRTTREISCGRKPWKSYGSVEFLRSVTNIRKSWEFDTFSKKRKEVMIVKIPRVPMFPHPWSVITTAETSMRGIQRASAHDSAVISFNFIALRKGPTLSKCNSGNVLSTSLLTLLACDVLSPFRRSCSRQCSATAPFWAAC